MKHNVENNFINQNNNACTPADDAHNLGCSAKLLEVKNLSISFKQYKSGFTQHNLNTIKDLNISVDGGEMVAIVGASGSGKSLLAHAILGILPYNAIVDGQINYCGETLTLDKIKKLRGKEIVLVPQSVTYLDPLMKTGKQLCRSKKDLTLLGRIKSIFSRYGLPEETDNLYPFELSGGMARRVLISSAVMESPKLVIADEPTPGLDLKVAKRVMTHFREMADNGAGVLVITHDLHLALECANRIVVFYDGETIDEVLPEDFKDINRLNHPYTKELWRAMPENEF